MTSRPHGLYVEFAPAAEREFKKLPRAVQVRLKPRIDALGQEPRPPGVEALSGEGGLYRVRVGDYRIIDTVQDDVLLVLVVRVGHRGEPYRRIRG